MSLPSSFLMGMLVFLMCYLYTLFILLLHSSLFYTVNLAHNLFGKTGSFFLS